MLLSIERKKEREMYVKGSYLQVMGLRKMFTFFFSWGWVFIKPNNQKKKGKKKLVFELIFEGIGKNC